MIEPSNRIAFPIESAKRSHARGNCGGVGLCPIRFFLNSKGIFLYVGVLGVLIGIQYNRLECCREVFQYVCRIGVRNLILDHLGGFDLNLYICQVYRS